MPTTANPEPGRSPGPPAQTHSIQQQGGRPRPGKPHTGVAAGMGTPGVKAVKPGPAPPRMSGCGGPACRPGSEPITQIPEPARTPFSAPPAGGFPGPAGPPASIKNGFRLSLGLGPGGLFWAKSGPWGVSTCVRAILGGTFFSLVLICDFSGVTKSGTAFPFLQRSAKLGLGSHFRPGGPGRLTGGCMY